MSAFKQVNSQTRTDELLFVVILRGVPGNETFFLTDKQAEPLLALWDLKREDIQRKDGPPVTMTPERRKRLALAYKRVRRARNRLDDLRHEEQPE